MITSRTVRGYTLIELMVSVAIFAIVMLAATSAYLSLVNYNRRATQVASLLNSLSFGVDSMARDIRTGRKYSCTSHTNLSCTSTQQSSGVSTFYFTDADGCQVTYAYTSGTKSLTKQVIDTPDAVCTNRTTEVIGSSATPGVTLESVKFYVRGTSKTDQMQPISTIVLKGSTLIVDTGEEVPFSLETSATSRMPDIETTTP